MTAPITPLTKLAKRVGSGQKSPRPRNGDTSKSSSATCKEATCAAAMARDTFCSERAQTEHNFTNSTGIAGAAAEAGFTKPEEQNLVDQLSAQTQPITRAPELSASVAAECDHPSNSEKDPLIDAASPWIEALDSSKFYSRPTLEAFIAWAAETVEERLGHPDSTKAQAFLNRLEDALRHGRTRAAEILLSLLAAYQESREEQERLCGPQTPAPTPDPMPSPSDPWATSGWRLWLTVGGIIGLGICALSVRWCRKSRQRQPRQHENPHMDMP